MIPVVRRWLLVVARLLISFSHPPRFVSSAARAFSFLLLFFFLFGGLAFGSVGNVTVLPVSPDSLDSLSGYCTGVVDGPLWGRFYLNGSLNVSVLPTNATFSRTVIAVPGVDNAVMSDLSASSDFLRWTYHLVASPSTKSMYVYGVDNLSSLFSFPDSFAGAFTASNSYVYTYTANNFSLSIYNRTGSNFTYWKNVTFSTTMPSPVDLEVIDGRLWASRNGQVYTVEGDGDLTPFLSINTSQHFAVDGDYVYSQRSGLVDIFNRSSLSRVRTCSMSTRGLGFNVNNGLMYSGSQVVRASDCVVVKNISLSVSGTDAILADDLFYYFFDDRVTATFFSVYWKHNDTLFFNDNYFTGSNYGPLTAVVSGSHACYANQRGQVVCFDSRFQSSYSSNVSVNLLNVSSGLVGGDNWTFSCSDDGLSFTNVSVSVETNDVPLPLDVQVVDLSGSLYCSYVYFDDENESFASDNFTWFVNDSLVGGVFNQSLNDSFYSEVDFINCGVWVNNSVGQVSGFVNSSVFNFSDTTPPVISTVVLVDTATTSQVVSIGVDCVDDGEIASGYPKVRWSSPMLGVQGNFTMGSVGADSFERQYIFTREGVYSGFTFYCLDGSGNLDSFVYPGSLVISSVDFPGPGPGGAGGVGGELGVCNLSVVPSRLLVSRTNFLYEVVVFNRDLESFNPTFKFLLSEGSVVPVSNLEVSNPIGTLLPGDQASFGVSYVGDVLPVGGASLVLSSLNCADVVVPIVFGSVAEDFFDLLFGPGFSVGALFGAELFSPGTRLGGVSFLVFGWLFLLVFLFLGVGFVPRLFDSFVKKEFLRIVIWVLLWLLVTVILSFAIFLGTRGGVVV